MYIAHTTASIDHLICACMCCLPTSSTAHKVQQHSTMTRDLMQRPARKLPGEVALLKDLFCSTREKGEVFFGSPNANNNFHSWSVSLSFQECQKEA